MIVGNNSAGGDRIVGLWDDVTISDDLTVGGTISAGGNVSGLTASLSYSCSWSGDEHEGNGSTWTADCGSNKVMRAIELRNDNNDGTQADYIKRIYCCSLSVSVQ